MGKKKGKKYDSKEHMALDRLESLFGIKPTGDDVYNGHAYSANENYRLFSGKNIELFEDTRYIRIDFKFSELFQPLKICCNKDNHMYNRVYLPEENNSELGPSFYIEDDKVQKLLSMSKEIISELNQTGFKINNQIEKNKKYLPLMEKEINSLNILVDVKIKLSVTPRDFIYLVCKGPKKEIFRIPFTDYKKVLAEIETKINKEFKDI